MNLPTILIALAVAALLGMAVRYLVKNGMCAACEDKSACQAAKKAGGPDLSSGCGGGCASCKYYEYELKALAAKQHQSGV
jgi:hypothetical protein